MDTIRVLAMLEANAISGTAKAVLEFAKEATRGRADLPKIELSIATFTRQKNEEGVSLKKAIGDVATPHDVIFERGRFDMNIVPQLRAIVEKRQIDVVWTNSVKSHFLVPWAGLNRSRKWVAFHHGYTQTDSKMRVYNQLDRWSLPTADQVLTTCLPFVGDLIRKNVKRDRIRVQRMPIRPFSTVSQSEKMELRQRLGCNDRTLVLLCVGRLSREKGHIDLIQALPKVRKLVGHLPLRLILVGEGPERLRIEELARRLQLTDIVTLTGQQDDVNHYYGIADLFVLPSHTEGCPNVLLEAMAAGVPIVATEVGGIPEVATSGEDAILVRKRDRIGLASAIASVLKDRVLRERLVASARSIVSSKTPEAYFKSIASVFRNICTNDN